MTIIEELQKAIPEAAAAGTELLRKSQMALDFSGPDPHHVAYTRITRSGTVSQIKAKGVKEQTGGHGRNLTPESNNPFYQVGAHEHEGMVIRTGERLMPRGTMQRRYFVGDKKFNTVMDAIRHVDDHGNQAPPATQRPVWDTDTSANDTADIKRRLVAAGFKKTDFKVRRPINSRTKGYDDAVINRMYTTTEGDIIDRSQGLIDAGFDVNWNTFGMNIDVHTHTSIKSVGRQGKINIYDWDLPAGSRKVATYNTAEEAKAAIKPELFHATPTIPKMAAELAKNNLDYNEFETKEGDCDSCGKVTDVRTVHDADNGGDTLYGQVCDDCLDEAHRHAYPDEGMRRIANGQWPHTSTFYKTRQELGQEFDDAFESSDYPGLPMLGSDWGFGSGLSTPAAFYRTALEKFRAKYPMDQDHLTWDKRTFKTQADIDAAIEDYKRDHSTE